MISFQKDVLVVSCDLVTDVALHHLADIHRSHDSTLSAFLAPVPQTSADREAASNPKAKKKTDNTGTSYIETNRITAFFRNMRTLLKSTVTTKYVIRCCQS